MRSLPGEFSPKDRFCVSSKGGTRGGGWGHPKGENVAIQALGSLWSTLARSREGHMPCFSINECRKLSFPHAVPPNCMFTAAFCARAHRPCPSENALQSGRG